MHGQKYRNKLIPSLFPKNKQKTHKLDLYFYFFSLHSAFKLEELARLMTSNISTNKRGLNCAGSLLFCLVLRGSWQSGYCTAVMVVKWEVTINCCPSDLSGGVKCKMQANIIAGNCYSKCTKRLLFRCLEVVSYCQNMWQNSLEKDVFLLLLYPKHLMKGGILILLVFAFLFQI